MLPDAYLRAGDCLFKLRRYEEAKDYYSRAIQKKHPGFVYALYQKGIIEGLLGNNYAKIITLEDIKTNHLGSEYLDNALMELGDTYIKLGNPDKASGTFLELISRFSNKSPFSNTARLRLGIINYNRGDITKALEFYKSVMDSNPSSNERIESIAAIEEIYLKDLNQADEFIFYIYKRLFKFFNSQGFLQ